MKQILRLFIDAIFIGAMAMAAAVSAIVLMWGIIVGITLIENL